MQTHSIELPAQGRDTVEILTNDHVALRRILSEVLHAKDRQRRIDAFEHLKGSLVIHNATEENIVYPAIAHIAGRYRQSQQLFHDTAEADLLFFQLDSLIRNGNHDAFMAIAPRFSDELQKHMLTEENIAFPRLQEHAEPEQADLLNYAVREFRASLRYQYSIPAG